MSKLISSIDLFSGAGGMAEGFSKVGIKSVAANDFDEMAAKTFTHNHPQVPFVCKDLARVQAKELLDAASQPKGSIDVVAGGPPCQGFSIAGRRIADDPRNSLFLEFVRVVDAVQPKVFLFENVRGIVSMQNGKVLEAILESFRTIGYNCCWRVVDASDYGVPQARPRFILVGTQPSVEFEFPKATHGIATKQKNLFGAQLQPKVTVWDALSDLPEIDQGQGAEELLHSGNYLNEYQASRKGRRNPGVIFNHRATKHSAEIQSRYRLIPEGQNNKSLPEEIRTKKANVFKLDRSAPARTVTCNHRTDLLHPTIPRGTTVREAARLQSFDDDYQFFGNLTRKAAWVTQDDQVGNAVPPLLAQALGGAIVEAVVTSQVELVRAIA